MAVPMECKNDDTLKKFELEYEELPFNSSKITKAHLKAARAKSKTTPPKR